MINNSINKKFSLLIGGTILILMSVFTIFMINHILLFCFSILMYEFIKYIKFTDIVKSNLKIYQKILKLIKYKKVSDFRKEKLIFNYSKSLFTLSIKIFLILILISIFIFIINLISQSFLNLIISIFGIIELSIIIIIYHQLRKKNYARLQ